MTADPVQRARTALRFLRGEGPIDGHWFGEKPADAKGNFWWRKYLADIEAALPTQESIRAEDDWQDISTAPRDDSRFLIGAWFGETIWDEGSCTWLWERIDGWWQTISYDESASRVHGERGWQHRNGPCAPGGLKATHWRPLPAPPIAASIRARGGESHG